MTTIEHSLSEAIEPKLSASTRIVWKITRADDRGRPSLERLVLQVEPVGCDYAAVEAWLERGDRIAPLLSRRLMRASITQEARMLHIDIPSGAVGRNLASLSFMFDDPDPSRYRLIYAQSSLLSANGLFPGSCDRPIGQCITHQPDAVSA